MMPHHKLPAPERIGRSNEKNADTDKGTNGEDDHRAESEDGDEDHHHSHRVPYFLSQHETYPLLADAGTAMGMRNTFLGGAIVIGQPNDPTKATTCAYLMEGFGEVVINFGKDEVAWMVCLGFAFSLVTNGVASSEHLHSVLIIFLH